MLSDFLQNKSHIALITHQRPDGDAIGSLLGMYHFIQTNHPDIYVTPVLLDDIPDFLSFLPGIDKIIHKMPDSIDGLITLDSATLDRTGLDSVPPQTLCIDHHKSNDGHASRQIVDTEAASTTQIISDIIQQNKYKMTSDMATCLLTGLYTDTGGFIHRNTDASVFATASFLSLQGADIKTLTQQIFKSQDYESVRAFGEAISRIQIHKQVGYVNLLDASEQKELKGRVVSQINSLTGVDMAVVFAQESTGIVRISYRTNSDDICVSTLAGYLGGGGHQKASGIALPDADMSEDTITIDRTTYTYTGYIDHFILKNL